MTRECEICGSEIEDTDKECPICSPKKDEKVIKNEKKKMIARCVESGYETEIDEDAEKFYCEECGFEHRINGDDFIKIPIGEEIKEETVVEKEQVEEALYLIFKKNEKEVIKVSKTGGIIGRDGDYGSDLFTKYSMLTVSRQHIKIEHNKIGDWIVWHLGTNDTEINGEKMLPNSPKILKNNDEITLAKISFRVEIK
ncbi:FHA domain-containing protein [Fusobacterium periodonticum]|jgi:FHA domain-containing protein|uniref:FHA domain-containing protein n=1 Tax=Fusobacterium periodonticum 1_1_41FAA TaxID=469621 RepID=D6LF56_9FUSO|nr:FHA domain-containing protein [Fusobacterium periodonticum]EFG28791.1 FHA domain protein [Fusobacterium periodonticum 1_1_41FAA]